ncbi:MAG TPA: MFS transporter [Alphaproteobacteria bacterium]|nr:MFS transporter [Alphaproteobacteria bacterium]
MGSKHSTPVVTGLSALPRGVWALGLVSLCMDMSSELIHSLLPVFLVGVLGASKTLVGLIEGIAEAMALIVKIFSGAASDYLGRRKALTLLGYGMAAVTKPLFPLAGSVATVFVARFIDRIGKGIRGAPRDALIADLTPANLRGASFGLRQSLDTVGAVAGPILAIIAMGQLDDDIRAVFWIAVIPAILSVIILVSFVQEPERPVTADPAPPLRAADVKTLGRAYWLVVATGAVLTLARFSEAFLVLRASEAGLADAYVPFVLVVMSVAYAASAYPAGAWSDRAGRKIVLVAGIGLLVVADVILALAPDIWLVMAGTLLWGLHMGLTQGLLAAMIADTVPRRLRGTAFGVFNLFSGIMMLAASVLAGMLWDRFGVTSTFVAGAIFSAMSLIGIVCFARPRTATPSR